MFLFIIFAFYMLNKIMLYDSQIVYKKNRLIYCFDNLSSPFLIRILRRHLRHRDMYPTSPTRTSDSLFPS